MVVGLIVTGVVVGLGGAAWAAVLLTLSALGAGVGAYLHATYGDAYWLALLWAATAGLIVMTVLAVFSVGIFILPGAVAALVAAIAGSVRSPRGNATA